jgi:hypothetical protein
MYQLYQRGLHEYIIADARDQGICQRAMKKDITAAEGDLEACFLLTDCETCAMIIVNYRFITTYQYEIADRFGERGSHLRSG